MLRNLDLASPLPQQLEGLLLPLDMNSNDSNPERTTRSDDKSEPATKNVIDQLLQVTMSPRTEEKLYIIQHLFY
jgi:hypothetical protein